MKDRPTRQDLACLLKSPSKIVLVYTNVGSAIRGEFSLLATQL